ncbi:MAG: DUF952 domain-containing protein [bacterium]|nr:DUF952 domain-containing protein [bacterium]
MSIICHICKVDEWEKAKEKGEFYPEEAKKDKGIKCSLPDTVLAVAKKKFSEHNDRVILMIDTVKLNSDVKYKGKKKDSEPFIQGPVNIDAVTDVFHLTPLHGSAPGDY